MSVVGFSGGQDSRGIVTPHMMMSCDLGFSGPVTVMSHVTV
jgi:hypothetical protein